jgi:hypothetical protein
MIQRIQTLFLILVAAAGILLFWVPLAEYYDEYNGNYRLMVTGLQCMDPDPRISTTFWFAVALLVVNILMPELALITIFLYKNRILQIRLIAVNLMITVIEVILIFLFYTSKVETLTSIKPAYQFGIFLPLIALVFLVLANRFIRRDETLVKSAGRLR